LQESLHDSISSDIGFEYVFKKYYARLCYFAYRLVGDRDAAEDIVQEIFMKFWDRREGFGNEPSVKTFLYLTVRNASLNFLRHAAVEQRYLDDALPLDSEPDKGLDQLIHAEVLAEIHRSICELPAACRQVVELAYFEGLKNNKIAERLGISVNTVKTQKQRALGHLRIRLDLSAYLAIWMMLNR
jgi:RNA polymerase sigma-70 factor (family 1)